jgi:hypothetical protein
MKAMFRLLYFLCLSLTRSSKNSISASLSLISYLILLNYSCFPSILWPTLVTNYLSAPELLFIFLFKSSIVFSFYSSCLFITALSFTSLQISISFFMNLAFLFTSSLIHSTSSSYSSTFSLKAPLYLSLSSLISADYSVICIPIDRVIS